MRILSGFRQWGTPYRQSAFWLIFIWASASLVSVITWLAGLLGVMIAIVIFGAAAIIGLIVLGLGLSRSWNERAEGLRSIRHTVVALLALSVGIFTILPVIWLTAMMMGWATLLWNYSSYGEIARLAERGEIKRDGQGWTQSKNGVSFILDEGPPARLAFPYPGGFLDNWSGIVHDPSHRVAAAKGLLADGQFTAPAGIKGLFDGDLMACTHMMGNFYDCSFT